VVPVDGTGVVSHAGTVLLGEVADRVGLTARFGEVVGGLRARQAGHEPGRVLVDVAVAIADGAEAISDVQALADQPALHGAMAPTATVWRVLAGVDAGRLAGTAAGPRASPGAGVGGPRGADRGRTAAGAGGG